MPEAIVTTKTLPDVQAQIDSRGHVIDRVGVSGIRHPFSFRSSDLTQPTIGTWRLLVSLAAEKRGTHMSRFMEILSELQQVQTIDTLIETTEAIRSRLDSEDASLTVDFPWFIEKSAPVTGAKGKLDVDVQIQIDRGTSNTCTLTVKGAATSLCPCSKQISDFGAHNQRCELTASIRFSDGETVSLEELFQLMENTASAQVFSIIKRSDEKYVTEQAWENPKFVEDTIRDLAEALKRDPRIRWYRCSAENFESIHNHNAFAQIEFDKAIN